MTEHGLMCLDWFSHMQVVGKLAGNFVESVSAGRHHISALAGPCNPATGKAQEGLESTMIFVWGQGEDGQLGAGRCKDSATPLLVEELKGRKIIQVVHSARSVNIWSL